MIGFLLFVPSLADFRYNYLHEKIIAGHTAALATEETDHDFISPDLEQELLKASGLQAVIVIQSGSRQILLRSELPATLLDRVDLKRDSFIEKISDAFQTLTRHSDGVILVIGDSVSDRYDSIEILIPEQPLHLAMIDYMQQTALTNILLIIATGVILFISLHFLVSKPMQQMVSRITNFRMNPTAPLDYQTAVDFKNNEIGMVEAELLRMQQDLQASLREKKNLAAVGEAVAKINHDLRNLLTTAQINSDTLQLVEDKTVQRLLPRIERSLEQAVNLCENTLRFSQKEEEQANPETLLLNELVEEIITIHGLNFRPDMQVTIDIPPNLTVYVDLEHLIRMLTNLIKNSDEAMMQRGSLTIAATADPSSMVHISVIDDGPGIPEALQPNLFKPFLASSKVGGSGLGLAIVLELAELNGGSACLLRSDASGTCFQISLPQFSKQQSEKTLMI